MSWYWVPETRCTVWFRTIKIHTHREHSMRFAYRLSRSPSFVSMYVCIQFFWCIFLQQFVRLSIFPSSPLYTLIHVQCELDRVYLHEVIARYKQNKSTKTKPGKRIKLPKTMCYLYMILGARKRQRLSRKEKKKDSWEYRKITIACWSLHSLRSFSYIYFFSILHQLLYCSFAVLNGYNQSDSESKLISHSLYEPCWYTSFPI